MDEIVNAPGQVKIEEATTISEATTIGETKVEIENCTTEHGTVKDVGLPKSNENGNLSVNCDGVTNGHRPVIAQVAPMTSIIRRSVEELGAFNALQTAAPIDKLALSQATKQEIQPNANFAVGSAPLTVNVAVSREISGNAVESSGGDYASPASDSVHIKRPMNAFLIWSTARRHQIKMGEPNITMAEISKRLGEEWKNMGFEERQPFVDRSKQLREEHMARYPNYKYQPRRRKVCNNSSTNLSTTAAGKIKSIKTTARLSQQSMTSSSSCDMSLHQSPQQDLNQQSQIQMKSYQQEPSSYHPDHIAVSHSPPRPASSSQTVHQYNQLQQPQQASTSDVLGQHTQQQQLVAINTTTPLPQNQLPQQQLIQPVNDNLITASTVQVNQWPTSIYPGLTLMGYHMTSNGMVPLYAPTQPMLPLISLPTATVGSVIQQRNPTTVETTLEEQQLPSQSQLKPSDNQQQAVLGMYTLTGSDRSIATMDITRELANEVKVSLTNSDSASAERKGPLETPATKDMKSEDISGSRTREVVSFTQI